MLGTGVWKYGGLVGGMDEWHVTGLLLHTLYLSFILSLPIPTLEADRVTLQYGFT